MPNNNKDPQWVQDTYYEAMKRNEVAAQRYKRENQSLSEENDRLRKILRDVHKYTSDQLAAKPDTTVFDLEERCKTMTRVVVQVNQHVARWERKTR